MFESGPITGMLWARALPGTGVNHSLVPMAKGGTGRRG